MKFSYFCRVLHLKHGKDDPKFIRNHKKQRVHYVRIDAENRKINCDAIAIRIQENIWHCGHKLNIISCCPDPNQNHYIAAKLQDIFPKNYIFANISYKMNHIGFSTEGIMLIPFHLDIDELIQTCRDFQFQNNVINLWIKL